MRRRLLAARESERGAALMLAIGFVLMVGAICAGLVTYLSTTVNHRTSLDAIRNRQYAADGAVEFAIAQVRSATDIDGSACASITRTINNVAIRVDCRKVPTLVQSGGFLVQQTNVVFTSCVNTGVACTDPKTVVRAQVNFARSSAGAVTNTYIQSWSVNQ